MKCIPAIRGTFAALALAACAHGATLSAQPGAPAYIVSRDDSGRICMWDSNGIPVRGWPVVASGAWPAGTPRLQDLDGDGQPEVVCLMKLPDGSRILRAWRLDGNSWPGYSPLACPQDMEDTPLLGDVEGRGAPDWVWPTRTGAVGISAVGDPLHPRLGSPLSMGNSNRLRLALADVDGDGVTEVLGGMEAGAAGRWFVLSLLSGDPTVFTQPTTSPVTSAPVAARIRPGPAPQILVALRSSLACYASDGLRGWNLMSGWPVNGAPACGGEMTRVLDPQARVAAQGASGRIGIYSIEGELLRDCAGSFSLGPPVGHAALDTLGHWAAHPGGNQLRFESDAGSDSAGRPGLFTRVLGDRHHGVMAPAPAGLLPRTRFHLWLNGLEADALRPPRLEGGQLRVHGSFDDPGRTGDPPVELVVRRGGMTVGRCEGRAALDLSLEVGAGLYTAVARLRADTLASIPFTVQGALTMKNVWFFPSPMRRQGAVLMELGADASVTADIYTVAGRRIRRIEGIFAPGSAQLAWDGLDQSGGVAANGVYFVKVRASSGTQSVETMTRMIRLN